MNENPGLAPDAKAARERDLIRRKQLGRLGTGRRSHIRQRTRDDNRATQPLDTFRATPRST